MNKKEDRGYQLRAVQKVRALWDKGASVCLVGPTGCGKTHMACDLISEAESVLWIVHRIDLLDQNAHSLRERFERDNVRILRSVHVARARRRIVVASVQTLLSKRGEQMLAGRTFSHAVIEECAHYRADDWQRVRERFIPRSKLLGLTAYPQRRDGRALGQMFDEKVVAANYFELIRAKQLVGARVWGPEKRLGHDLAQDPVSEWLRHSEDSQTFVFVPRIEQAHAMAKAFRLAGVTAEVVASGDPKIERRERMQRFRQGLIKVLISVEALVEGIDVPEARCVVLARAFRFLGGYIQATGRVLRAAPGKRDAIVIDLVGAWAKHGLPDQDREYSLSGDDHDERGGHGNGGGVGGGEASTEIQQEILDEPMRLISRGALKPGEQTVPVERRAAIADLTPVKTELAMPRVTRATKARDLFGPQPAATK